MRCVVALHRDVIVQESPTKIRLSGLPEGELRRQLTFVDRSVDFEIQKAKHSRWLRDKLGEEEFKLHLENLKQKRIRCLLFEDNKGLWTFSGLGKFLSEKMNCQYVNELPVLEPQRIPWHREPEKKLRDYQQKACEELLKARHAAVEVGTGLGKSFCILMLAKQLGMKTVVMTPSVSIAEQIYREFKHHLGTRYVGQFFDGKKESKKLFVIAVDDSLAKVDEESLHWKELASARVFIADESHLCPAKTLEKVCHGLLSDASYRFFFSGTQMRNDGLGLLLHAITGDIVFRMSVEDGVNQGWLSKPMFRIVPYQSTCNFNSRDANEMTRAHLYYEPTVNAKAGEIANLMVEELGRQVVILVKELEQFSWLLPHLRHKAKFAHGGVTPENRKFVPQEYWESDPTKLVEEFNQGEFPILVGTSCITTGTDIQTVGAILYMQGGRSEIQVRQAVGRGTRRPPGKVDCYFIDFDPENIDTPHRHALERADIYSGIYPDVERFTL